MTHVTENNDSRREIDTTIEKKTLEHTKNITTELNITKFISEENTGETSPTNDKLQTSKMLTLEQDQNRSQSMEVGSLNLIE